jgi:UDP-glucose 4-epimerase
MISWSNTKALVTGGAGFIGSHLCELLVTSGADVTIVDNLSSGDKGNLSKISAAVHFEELDITKLDWRQVLTRQPFDVIFHLAANAYVPPSVENPAWDYQINLAGTFQLLDVLRQIKWPGVLIYASSAAVYGDPQRIPIQEGDLTVPISPYGVGKLAAERYIAVYSQLYGLRAASLRLFSVYGPRQCKQVVYDLIRKMIQNPSAVNIYGDGTQVRDFNFVEDTARAMMVTADHALLQGEIYNLASGRECSIRELVDTLCNILGVEPKRIYSGSIRPGDPEKWTVDITRLMSLGYKPIVSLEDGLSRTVEWYRSTLTG